jgi:hypothetical protein
MAQQLLLKVGCRVVPGQAYLAHAASAFDAEGRLTDDKAGKAAKELMEKLAREASPPAA